MPGRDGTSAIEGLIERGLNTLDNFYVWLERYLIENEFVAGNNFTMADITAFVAVDFSEWVKRKIPKENTKTLEWYNKVSLRGSAKA